MRDEGDLIFPEDAWEKDARETRSERSQGNTNASRIPVNHVLREFFGELVERKLHGEVGVEDQNVCSYVANLLADFCEAEQLYKIQDAAGRPLHDVGEMLLESDPIYGPAPFFDREREVRKHIGDYTLFFAGMFPESINHFRLRRQRLENFVDFIKAGKESYYIVSQFNVFEYKDESQLFSHLSEGFESCIYGLNMVKNELQEMQHPIARTTKEFLM